jgi:excisionase family DNA binding protein
MPAKKFLLRAKDVAHILDCSPDDVVELARKGRLKATKAGRFWRFRNRDVLAYKRKQEKDEQARRL